MILLAAFLSFKTTNAEIRKKNHFTWGAIQEVAVLFIGIFITMQPALMILKSAGAELGLTHPSQMFWVTGALSSFLDNTPTYLVFLTTAGTRQHNDHTIYPKKLGILTPFSSDIDLTMKLGALPI